MSFVNKVYDDETKQMHQVDAVCLGAGKLDKLKC